MKKTNFNLDSHSSLIIADGDTIIINGQKVLLTLVKDADALDVTDAPPLPSLKYEDCFERIRPQFWVDEYANIFECEDSKDQNNVPTKRQAKQLAATIKLMTIMHDANGGEWIAKNNEQLWCPYYYRPNNRVEFSNYLLTIPNPIYFRDYETAQRAYESNKEIFHEYFGINE